MVVPDIVLCVRADVAVELDVSHVPVTQQVRQAGRGAEDGRRSWLDLVEDRQTELGQANRVGTGKQS